MQEKESQEYTTYQKVKPRYKTVLPIGCVILIAAFFYLRAPITTGDWTKQTVYLALINSLHCQIADATPTLLLIDDDGGNGIYAIKAICDELGMKATFAMIPMKTDQATCDTLVAWQREGFGIAIHGFNHHTWKEWSTDSVLTDLNRCERYLRQKGFDMQKIRLVVPPHGCNTKDIREAVYTKGYQMVTGANTINPDTTVFQLGRLFITRDTDLSKVKGYLSRALRDKAYVILGTHSSHPEEFSRENTIAVLKMAQDLGFQ